MNLPKVNMFDFIFFINILVGEQLVQKALLRGSFIDDSCYMSLEPE